MAGSEKERDGEREVERQRGREMWRERETEKERGGGRRMSNEPECLTSKQEDRWCGDSNQASDERFRCIELISCTPVTFGGPTELPR